MTRPPLTGFSVMVLGADAGDAVVVGDLAGAHVLVDACRAAPLGGVPPLRPDDVVVACTDAASAQHLTGAGLVPLVPVGPDAGTRPDVDAGAVTGAVTEHLLATRLRRVRTHAGLLEVRGHEVRLDGAALPLSPVPMALLRVLSRSPGVVVDRHRLLAAMHGASDLHAVEVAVARLRAGIGRAGVVEPVVERGYRLAVVEH